MNGKLSEHRLDRRRFWFADFMKRLVKEKPLGTVGLIITVLLLFTGIFADLLAPYGYQEIFTDHLLAAPSGQFWLGTDNLGRDMLSRIIYGARISVIVGLSASMISTLVSAFLGMLTGFLGRKFDLIVQRFVDAWMCMPQLILLMVIISMIGRGMWSLIIVLGLSWGIGGSREIRGATMAIRENQYVHAARSIGCSTTRTLMRHILPNIMVPVIVQFSVRVPAAILIEASLSFLGFGIPPPAPSWGGMLSGAGRDYMYMAPWMAIWPGVALSIVVYGVNMFGDALRDLLDPRLRGGAGRYGINAQKKVARKVAAIG
ncbi:MAG: ABC transporter permease [Spirochaetales bacterium]|nr:ABC transporter permease [Spirochaetales bacterium]